MGHVKPISQVVQKVVSSESEAKPQRVSNRRRLRKVINIDDFEAAAAEILPPKYFACEILLFLVRNRH